MICVVLLLAGTCTGAVVPNGLVADGMVLQRNQPVRIFGTADVQEKVTVSFNGQTVSTRTENGSWEVVLEPMKHGGPYDMTIFRGYRR